MAGGRETWSGYTSRQYLSSGADTDYNQAAISGTSSLAVAVGSKSVYPSLVRVGTAGVLAFVDAQGDNCKITTVTNGEEFPIRARSLIGGETTADHITFIYNES